MLDKLQYISQGKTATEQIRNIRNALDNGAGLIQLRWKESSYDQQLELALATRKICQAYKATCIINDHINIAAAIAADGVHLGLDDDAIAKARNTVGPDKIIGGTANTLNDILQRTAEGCDYIGLGPYRFTTTKEKLSPELGLAGYQNIFNHLQEQGIKTPPIYAIGGIEIHDIPALLQAGVYGVAVSGLITRQPALVPQIKKLLV
ncbi:MAG: thiamine phosphate synthase [Chitinophagaceae bacterium]|nr:MAG: thiamine phosphate synthase [Chitinophagaceae bacterium]